MRTGFAVATLALAVVASAKPSCTSVCIPFAPNQRDVSIDLREQDDCVNGSVIDVGRSSNVISGEQSERQSWTSWQKLVVAHAALSAIGFIVLLPLSSLLARWTRTFVPGFVWFTGHWVFNLLLGAIWLDIPLFDILTVIAAGPVIIVGFLLVHIAENKGGGEAPDSIHSVCNHSASARHFLNVI